MDMRTDVSEAYVASVFNVGLKMETECSSKQLVGNHLSDYGAIDPKIITSESLVH
jgi:hypothetical protein